MDLNMGCVSGLIPQCPNGWELGCIAASGEERSMMAKMNELPSTAALYPFELVQSVGMTYGL